MTTNQLLNALTSHNEAATRLRCRADTVASSLQSLLNMNVDAESKLLAIQQYAASLAEGVAAFDKATV